MRFILLSFWLLLVPFFHGVLAQSFQSSQAQRAWSKSLLVYEKPDTTSTVIGRLIYDEIILEVKGSKTQTDDGTWIKIKSPYEGYYLKQQEENPFSMFDSRKKKKKSHFRSNRQGRFQKKPTREEDDEIIEISDKKEETPGFFSRLFNSFFDDDEKEEQSEKKSEKKKRNVSSFFAQKKGSIWVGIGLGVWSLPEERGYDTSSLLLDLSLEFADTNTLLSKFKFGYNQYQSKKSGYTVSTSSIYAVYKVSADKIKIENVSIYAYGGAALMMSTLSGSVSGSDQGIGPKVGFGGNYKISNSMKIGGQFMYASKQASFGSIKRYVGATHLQLIGSMSF